MTKLKYPVYRPSFYGNEKTYVNDCLDSTWISSKGKYVAMFEEAFSQKIGANHSVSVCNGTVALHLALDSLGIGPGDEVLVPTLTYVASVNAIHYTGAKPVFVDSLHGSWQMDPADVKAKITANTRAVMCVHVYGQSCDMEAISAICKANDLYLVEDCAEALGTYFKGQHVGNIGHIGTFSFYGNKTITTGEGGMVVTNDPELHQKIVKRRGQGLASNREYWHDDIGYNYRMTNICAALGLAQLEHLDEILKKKRQIAQWYQKAFTGTHIEFHQEQPDTIHSYWMCTILLPRDTDREGLKLYLIEQGIESRPMFYPIHTMPIYFEGQIPFPVAESLAPRGMNLPSYPDLNEQDIQKIADCVIRFVNG